MNLLQWLGRPRRNLMPRVAVWLGTLKLPRDFDAAAFRKHPIVARFADELANGERFLALTLEGSELSIVGWDWRDDYEDQDGRLGTVLEFAAARGAKGTVRRWGELGTVIRDRKPKALGAERWLSWTLKAGEVEIDEGERVGDKKIAEVLAKVVPAVEAWFSAHRAAQTRMAHRELYGFVDRAGNVVIEPKLIRAYEFTEGLAPVTLDDGSTFVTPSGEFMEGRWVRVNHFLRGLGPVMATPGPGERWGYVDREGTMRIEPRFSAAEPFYGPLAQVDTGTIFAPERHWIDTSGTIVGEPFDHTTGFAEDTAFVYKNSERSFACIDASGRPRFDRRFANATKMSSGLCAVAEIGGTHWGYVDGKGHTVIDPRFDVAWPFVEDRAVVKVGKRHSIIDRDGKTVGPDYDGVPLGTFTDGLLAVVVKDKVGFVDTAGRMVIEPIFDEAYGFYEGLAYARIGKGWGHLDRTGRFILEPKLEWTNAFHEGLAPAKRDGLYGFIDRAGAWVVAPRWKQIQHRFAHGCAWVQLP